MVKFTRECISYYTDLSLSYLVRASLPSLRFVVASSLWLFPTLRAFNFRRDGRWPIELAAVVRCCRCVGALVVDGFSVERGVHGRTRLLAARHEVYMSECTCRERYDVCWRNVCMRREMYSMSAREEFPER